MSDLETTRYDEDDAATGFWEHRQIGRIAAPMLARIANTAAAQSYGTGEVAELEQAGVEPQSTAP